MPEPSLSADFLFTRAAALITCFCGRTVYATELKPLIINASIVVLAEAHNPTILHPVFLAGQGIVPGDWRLAEPPVCTPAISLIKYANGTTFTAEPNKFQVLETSVTPDSTLADVVIRYLAALPHVRYTATGINIAAYAQQESPSKFILNRFIRPGPWSTKPLEPADLAIRFTYPVQGGVVNLQCEAGSVQKPNEGSEVESLLLNANYHTLIEGENRLDQAKSSVGVYRERVLHFLELTQTLFGIEEQS